MALLGLVLLIGLLPPVLAGSVRAQTRPNFVVIVTDDMRTADWDALPKTRALLEQHGTRFDNFFVTTSLCCPSRASILTGQYVHNHGVTFDWKQFDPNGLGDETIAWALDRAGYRTALIGKYLNGLPERRNVPPGWDQFVANGNGDYYSVVMNENGSRTKYKKSRYETDILGAEAQDFLRGVGSDEPFLLYLAPKAPHAPFLSPSRYREAFTSAAVERSPDFNEQDVSDKPLHIRNLPLQDEAHYDDVHRKRLRTLITVDDLIVDIWDSLAASGRLQNTYFFVLSDNGYTIGHHRRVGKTAPYDMSVRVPMYAFGPGFDAGVVDSRLVANIDLAPTIAQAAGVALPEADGFSLVGSSSRDELLLEWQYVYATTVASTGAEFEVAAAEAAVAAEVSEVEPVPADDESVAADSKETRKQKKKKIKKDERQRNAGANRVSTGEVPGYLGLRTLDTLYVVYNTGERELYHYKTDPYELDNLLATWEGHAPTAEAEALAATLNARMEMLKVCAGASCR